IEDITKKVVNQVIEQKQKKETEATRIVNLSKTHSKNNLPIEQNTMEFASVFNTTKEEQEKKIVTRYFPGLNPQGEKRFVKFGTGTLEGNELVKLEDLNTLLACFLLLQHADKRKGYSFETSYNKLAKMVFDVPDSRPAGGREIAEIKKSLNRLSVCIMETNFWWHKIGNERIVKKITHLMANEEGEEESVRISFSEDIAKSMEMGYIRWLEDKKLKDILRLRGHAKVLVLFFLKRIGQEKLGVYTMESVLEYLGVKEKYEKMPTMYKNQEIKRTIIPAIEKAVKVLGLSYKIVPEKHPEKIFIFKEQKKLAPKENI
ncbi:MAG TPA: hypothetical protein P5150_09470, partial [Candidatus Ratteibacteria bacterium]|nr:hypothetical protein [Candidatus Ratteibacteria bacterium]